MAENAGVMMHQCKIVIDGAPYSFPVEGDFFWGKDELLFPTPDNLISKTPWQQQGYSVMPAFSQDEFDLGESFDYQKYSCNTKDEKCSR
jgi:hypothetical protein